MARFELRVPDEQLAQWRAAAKREGLSLSEWIRARCEVEDEPAPMSLPDLIGAQRKHKVAVEQTLSPPSSLSEFLARRLDRASGS